MLLRSFDLGGKAGGSGSSPLEELSVSNGPLIRPSECSPVVWPFGTR